MARFPSLVLPLLFGLLLLGLLLLGGCKRFDRVERVVAAPDDPPLPLFEAATKEAPFLKAHLMNGQVYVLSNWRVARGAGQVLGEGTLLDLNRDTLARGAFSVPLDSVALLETNRLRPSSPALSLTVLTGISAAVTVACLSNPKACFGSCPTFYTPGADGPLLQAEGFSSSIAPSLEAADVDALARTHATGTTFRVEMRNEALETHVVRHVDLLAAPRPVGGRVMQGVDGRFHTVRALYAPLTCTAPEGDCRPALAALDSQERFSLADSTDLAAKETLDLTFDVPAGRAAGLVLGARQTLLPTYLLYQTFAYMGREAGAWLARHERSDVALTGSGPARLIGGIEVQVQEATGAWTTVGSVREHGPLATDVHLIPLPPLPPGRQTIRLHLTRGAWRIDYAALAPVGVAVQPRRLHPVAVYRADVRDAEARALLLDSTRTLTTMPGDTYVLEYRLDEGFDGYDLFLESRGYYLEWIRQEWLAEEDPQRLARMLFAPQQMLRELAPAFKAVEPGMEDAFWRSRYAR